MKRVKLSEHYFDNYCNVHGCDSPPYTAGFCEKHSKSRDKNGEMYEK